MSRESKSKQTMIDAVIPLINHEDLYPAAYAEDFLQLNAWSRDDFKLPGEYGYGYGYQKNAEIDPENATKEEMAIFQLDKSFKALLEKEMLNTLPSSIQTVIKSLSGYYEETLRDELIVSNKENKTDVQKSNKGDELFTNLEAFEEDHPLLSRRLHFPW